MDANFARAYLALTFASGPTNSLRGASLLTGLANAVVIDIGGTTSDIGVIQDGLPGESNAAIEVGGVRTNFRMPDIHAIGLGGGSLGQNQGRTIGPTSVGHELVTHIRAQATQTAIAAGAQANTIRTSDIEETAISYISENTTRLRIKVVGEIDTAQQPESQKPKSNP